MAAARPDFELDQHLFFWLTQVIGARDRRLNQELKGFGLRVPEWRALAALYSRKHCTMSELADLASIDRTTLTRTIDRMEHAGWLERLSDGADMRITLGRNSTFEPLAAPLPDVPHRPPRLAMLTCWMPVKCVSVSCASIRSPSIRISSTSVCGTPSASIRSRFGCLRDPATGL